MRQSGLMRLARLSRASAIKYGPFPNKFQIAEIIQTHRLFVNFEGGRTPLLQALGSQHFKGREMRHVHVDRGD